MTQVFYVDVLFVAPASADKLVYPKCNMAVVTKGDHDKALIDARKGYDFQRNDVGDSAVDAMDSFMCRRIRTSESLLRRALDQVSGPDLWAAINEFLGGQEYRVCADGPCCTQGLHSASDAKVV